MKIIITDIQNKVPGHIFVDSAKIPEFAKRGNVRGFLIKLLF